MATVARVTCDGIDANAEQVNRGMAWVYHKYAKDHSLYVLQHDATVAKRGLWADAPPLLHPGNGGSLCATHQPLCCAMPDTDDLQKYMALVDKLVQFADKEELAECARLLAMNVAHYEMIYGDLPLQNRLAMIYADELND